MKYELTQLNPKTSICALPLNLKIKKKQPKTSFFWCVFLFVLFCFCFIFCLFLFLFFALGSRLPTDEDFAFLLEDRAFADYFNIFLTLPVGSTLFINPLVSSVKTANNVILND